MASLQPLNSPRPSRAELGVAWQIRGRRLADQFAFFLAIVGYDPDDKSWDSWIYLIYLAVFFGFIGFGVLAYFADLVARPLRLLPTDDPHKAAVAVSVLVFLVWLLWKLYRFGRTSPLVFSDNDARILCQSPIDRRAVVFPWLIAEWVLPTFVWASAVAILAFAVEDMLVEQSGSFEFGPYLVAGVRAVTIVVPLQFGLLTLTWIFGLLRVQRDQFRPKMAWVAPIVAILFLVGFMVGSNSVWLQILSPQLQFLLAPFAIPLRSAFGDLPWTVGMIITLGLCVIGVFGLFVSARHVNLGRCAQETQMVANQRAALQAGDFGYGRRSRATRRSGDGLPRFSRLPAGHGVWALLWKDTLQSLRAFTWGTGLQWFGIFFLVAGVIYVPNVLATGILFIVLAQLFSRRATARLRDNLQNWWMWRQLPISAEKTLLISTITPWLLGLSVAALPITLAVFLEPFLPLPWLLLLPTTVLCMVISAEYALLRRARPEQLINGIIPEPTDFAAFLAFVMTFAALLPGLILWQIGQPLVIALAVSISLQMGLTYLVWTWAVHAQRKL
jgi:hypothetical protein